MKSKQRNDAADSKAGTLVDRSGGLRGDLSSSRRSDLSSGALVDPSGGARSDLSSGGEASESADSSGGLRMTRQRQVILDEFRTAGLHHTADEVYLAVRRTLPNISLGTVYRNLDVLTRAGLIRTLSLGGGQRLYDGGMHPHYHVRCRQCGRICDLPPDEFADLDAAARNACDFQILGHELGFEGLCSECGAALSTAADQAASHEMATEPEQTDSATRTSTGHSAATRSQDSLLQQKTGVGP